MEYSEARGTLIPEKNLKLKISCQTPCNADPNTSFHCNADPVPTFHFKANPDPYSAPNQSDSRFHCERPRPSRLAFEPLKLLHFHSNTDQDPAFHSYVDPDPAFHSNADSDQDPVFPSYADSDPAFHSNADSDQDPAFHS
jgi:hypothetical protein